MRKYVQTDARVFYSIVIIALGIFSFIGWGSEEIKKINIDIEDIGDVSIGLDGVIINLQLKINNYGALPMNILGGVYGVYWGDEPYAELFGEYLGSGNIPSVQVQPYSSSYVNTSFHIDNRDIISSSTMY